ncbi:MAG: lipopolysaccharide biosynthesis protein [Bacillota bacterium]
MSLVSIKGAFTGKGIVHIMFRTSVTNFAVMAFATLTSIVTSRIFGVSGKGELTAILFWSTFLAGILSFGLPTSLIYNVKKHRDNVPDYMKLCLIYQISISVLVGIIFWIFLPKWMSDYPDSVIQISRWFTVLNLPLLLLINVLIALSQSLNKFDVYNRLRLYVPLFNFIGLFFLWGIGGLDLQSAAMVYLLTTTLVVIWSFYKLKGDLEMDWTKKIKEKFVFKTLFGYGSRVYGTEFLGSIYNQFDKLIILSMLTAKELGLYTVMYTCSRLFNIVQSAITNVIFPKVVGLKNEEVIQKVGVAFRISTLAMLLILIPGMFIGHYLIGVFFGEAFLGAKLTFYLLCIECVIGGSSWILTTSFNAVGRPGLVLVRQLIALKVTIAMFYLCIPIFGMDGVAIALLVGAVIRMVFSLVSVVILFKVPLHKIVFNINDIDYVKRILMNRRKGVSG